MLRSYTPADALTIANASCGTLAILLCIQYVATAEERNLWMAFALLPLALVFDVLDGYVARLNRKRQSLLGADLDSLSETIGTINAAGTSDRAKSNTIPLATLES